MTVDAIEIETRNDPGKAVSPHQKTLEGHSADEVVSLVKSGMRLFVHGACATPHPLLEAICRRDDLRELDFYHLHLSGDAPHAAPELSARYHAYSLFTGANLRSAINEGRADQIPIFLSDIPWLFKSGKVRLDAALVQVSPPDRHGWCSLGTSVDAARAAVDAAPLVLAEINRQMPRTHGDSFVHLRQIARFVVADRALSQHPPSPVGEVEMAIGKHVADMIEDGDTLQMGIGGVPDAVLRQLGNKNDLGIHTEMFSDGVVELVQKGVVTNRRKTINSNRIVTSFVNGSGPLFDFVNDNPRVEFRPCDYTNDTGVIRQHDGMVAINSALEVDLSGQVCADSIGHRIYSGIGGQMDFVRGAALAVRGKPIIALSSTARKGTTSRIVPTLQPGAGVVTTRGHVHWVVTEYGAVNLHGMSLRERGDALISIAHPDFRPDLRAAFRALRHFSMGDSR